MRENFEEGKLKYPPIKLNLKVDASPVFAKAREIPLALRNGYAAKITKKLTLNCIKELSFPNGYQLLLNNEVRLVLLDIISPLLIQEL